MFARITPRPFLLLLALAGVPRVAAQEGPLPPPPPTDRAERPGLLRLGGVYVTPYLRLNSAGLDTNVFYTAEDRRTDLSANGGPGIDFIVPAGNLRFLVGGGLDYVWFARTASQRRLGGGGRARAEWETARIRLGAQESYTRVFQRPGPEVDERVLQEAWTTNADLKVGVGSRYGVDVLATRTSSRIPEPASFRGTDLRRTLTRETGVLTAGLRYRIASKTFLLVRGDVQQDRFELASGRDADSTRLYGGFEIRSATRLDGRLLGGVRRFNPKTALARDETVPYGTADLAWRFGPHTVLRGTYERDLAYSAFDVLGASPTLRREHIGGRLEKGLFGRVDLWFLGALDRFETSGPVTLLDQGGPQTGVRDDTLWSAGADLGYRFRSHVRIGLAATYTERRSTFADLGIRGALIGATVRYIPRN